MERLESSPAAAVVWFHILLSWWRVWGRLVEAWGEVQHSGQEEPGIFSSSVLHEDFLSSLTSLDLVAGNTHTMRPSSLLSGIQHSLVL